MIFEKQNLYLPLSNYYFIKKEQFQYRSTKKSFVSHFAFLSHLNIKVSKVNYINQTWDK